MTKWLPFDTPLDDEIAAFTEDLINIWEGDWLENIVNDPATADKLEDDFRNDLLEDEDGNLPTWLDPDIGLQDAVDKIDNLISVVKARLDMGFSKDPPETPLWPLSIPLTIAALVTGVVISR